MTSKKLFNLVAVIFIDLLIAELIGHVAYMMIGGHWLWQLPDQEIFRIRSFTQRVSDDRIVTNLQDTYNKEYGYGFDQFGFRIGTHDYFTSGTGNIVFLGDSVPFGWGVRYTSTLPSLFFDALRPLHVTIGVINGGVPSYTLHQAVWRYKEEIHGKFPVRMVVLQTIDPANQLARYGSEWTARMNWVTQDEVTVAGRMQKSFLFRSSSIFHTLANIVSRFSSAGPPLDLHDTETVQRFQRENDDDLSLLLQMVKQDGGILVLLPANPAISYKQKLKDGSADIYTHAIDLFNTTLSDFAASNPGVYFFDVSDEFDKRGREKAFVDNCCHLSRVGAQIEATFLVDRMRKAKLL